MSSTPAVRARVAMHFADGSIIDTWNALAWKVSFTDPLDHLSFTSIPPRDQYAAYKAKLAKGELVTILINDVPQGAFIIQTVDRTSDDAGLAIHVTLHNPLITPHEGDVDPDLCLTPQTDVPVTAAVLTALAPFGFETVQGDTRATAMAVTGVPIGGPGGTPINVPALKHSSCVAHAGTTAYAWCSHIFTRLGCVMRFAVDGTILVAAPDYLQSPIYTLICSTHPGAPGNYYLGKVTVHDSNEGQYSACTVRGQRGMPPLGVSSTNVARPSGYVAAADVLPARSAYASEVAPWKPKYLEDKKSSDPNVCNTVAHLELGAKAAGAYYVEGPVNGWVSVEGAIWQVDTTVTLVHEPEGIDNEVFWISEITRTQSADASGNGGQMTLIRCLPLGALIIGDPKALLRK
jgi:hypothetical protein